MIKVKVFCVICSMYRDIELNTYEMQGDVFIETTDEQASKALKCPTCGFRANISCRVEV